jgi:hypothetical protein
LSSRRLVSIPSLHGGGAQCRAGTTIPNDPRGISNIP